MHLHSGSGSRDQRRLPRVVYRSQAWLRLEGEEGPVPARVHNLSPLGMFVTADHLPGAGAPILCQFVLGTSARELRGRVKWVGDAGPVAQVEGTGAGIEFIDLSTQDHEALWQIAQAPMPEDSGAVPELVIEESEPLHQVEVKFAGLPQPVRARARVGRDGMVLATRLPFMAIGSQVSVSFDVPVAGRQSRRGTIESVAVEPSRDGKVPRILIRLSTPDARSESGTLVVPESFAPPDVRTRLPGMTPQSMQIVLPTEVFLSAPLEVTPVVTPREPGPALPEAGPQDTEPNPLGVREETEGDLTDIPVFTPARARPLVNGPSPVSEPTMRVTFPPPPPGLLAPVGARRKRGILLAGIAAVLVVAGVLLAKSGADAPDANSSAGTDARHTAAPLRESDNGIVSNADPHNANAESPARAASGIEIRSLPPTAAQTPPPAPSPPQASEWPFTFIAGERTSEVVVPLSGSTTEARSYAVTNPAGAAAMFPLARVPGRAGRFVVDAGGVRQVWVESRDEGVHVRLLLQGKRPLPTVHINADGVRFVVTR